MQRLHMAAAGNADENINLIDHRFQAEALRALRGYDVGVLNNTFFDSGHKDGTERVPNQAFMWKLTAANILDITVGRGMATAYGVDMKSEQTVHLTATAPSVGTKYVFVYLEWDLSNPVEGNGKIDIHDNGSSASWTPSRQDNLITNPIGVYQLPLYRMAVNTTGIISNITDWETLGVSTIGYPLRAEHANHAEIADDTKTIAGGAVSMNTAKDLLLHNDKIICRKKYLWIGDAEFPQIGDTFTLSEELKEGDIVEIMIDPYYVKSQDKTKPTFQILRAVVCQYPLFSSSEATKQILGCGFSGTDAQVYNSRMNGTWTFFQVSGKSFKLLSKYLSGAYVGGENQYMNAWIYLRSIAKIYE